MIENEASCEPTEMTSANPPHPVNRSLVTVEAKTFVGKGSGHQITSRWAVVEQMAERLPRVAASRSAGTAATAAPAGCISNCGSAPSLDASTPDSSIARGNGGADVSFELTRRSGRVLLDSVEHTRKREYLSQRLEEGWNASDEQDEGRSIQRWHPPTAAITIRTGRKSDRICGVKTARL